MRPTSGFLLRTFGATLGATLLVLTACALGQNNPTTRAADAANAAARVVPAADQISSPAESSDLTPAEAPPRPGSMAPAAAKEKTEKTEHEKRMELIGLSLGCVTAVMGLGIAFFAIWIDYRKSRDLMTICHQERMAALEKGLELPTFPPEFGPSDIAPKRSAPGTGLKHGLMWFAVGIGLWLFLSPKNHGFLHPSVGAIPGAVGVAYLVYYAVEGRRRSTAKNTPNL